MELQPTICYQAVRSQDSRLIEYACTRILDWPNAFLAGISDCKRFTRHVFD